VGSQGFRAFRGCCRAAVNRLSETDSLPSPEGGRRPLGGSANSPALPGWAESSGIQTAVCRTQSRLCSKGQRAPGRQSTARHSSARWPFPLRIPWTASNGEDRVCKSLFLFW
jgi:hypothetical protein